MLISLFVLNKNTIILCLRYVIFLDNQTNLYKLAKVVVTASALALWSPLQTETQDFSVPRAYDTIVILWIMGTWDDKYTVVVQQVS